MSKKRGQNEGSIRQRKDGKYEVRITAGIDFEKGAVKRVSFYACLLYTSDAADER